MVNWLFLSPDTPNWSVLQMPRCWECDDGGIAGGAAAVVAEGCPSFQGPCSLGAHGQKRSFGWLDIGSAIRHRAKARSCWTRQTIYRPWCWKRQCSCSSSVPSLHGLPWPPLLLPPINCAPKRSKVQNKKKNNKVWELRGHFYDLLEGKEFKYDCKNLP